MGVQHKLSRNGVSILEDAGLRGVVSLDDVSKLGHETIEGLLQQQLSVGDKDLIVQALNHKPANGYISFLRGRVGKRIVGYGLAIAVLAGSLYFAYQATAYDHEASSFQERK